MDHDSAILWRSQLALGCLALLMPAMTSRRAQNIGTVEAMPRLRNARNASFLCLVTGAKGTTAEPSGVQSTSSVRRHTCRPKRRHHIIAPEEQPTSQLVNDRKPRRCDWLHLGVHSCAKGHEVS